MLNFVPLSLRPQQAEKVNLFYIFQSFEAIFGFWQRNFRIVHIINMSRCSFGTFYEIKWLKFDHCVFGVQPSLIPCSLIRASFLKTRTTRQIFSRQLGSNNLDRDNPTMFLVSFYIENSWILMNIITPQYCMDMAALPLKYE